MAMQAKMAQQAKTPYPGAWCKNVLESAGIDEYKFTVHSTRSASRYDDVSRLV